MVDRVTIDSSLVAAMRPTLLAGGYNVLLGAGASRGSKNRKDEDLPLADDLRKKLIELKGLRQTSSLYRAYKNLDEEEINSEITLPFSSTKASETLKRFTRFFWRRIYTLNVDDTLEDAYETGGAVQTADPLTHQALYRNVGSISSVQIIHIHGYTRKPDDGYVFSLEEYAKTMGPGNPWVNTLSQTMSSEAFIIAGTTLEEPDLEYFLSSRTQSSARDDRGPSFLIEPYPDPGTLADCERHGLNLYPGTIEQFIFELESVFPNRPFPRTVEANLKSDRFSSPITAREIALLSRDFKYVTPLTPNDNLDYGFFVGQEPTLQDIGLDRDIPRDANVSLKNLIRHHLRQIDKLDKFILIEDSVGAGKSTILKRVIYDLTCEGISVFLFEPKSSINLDLCAKLLSAYKERFIIVVDDFADFGPVFLELESKLFRDDLLVIAAERSYRIDQVKKLLSPYRVTHKRLPKLTKPEAKALINKMDSVGLTTPSFNSNKIDSYANEIISDPIAAAVCRIMQDFRPMDRIVESIISDADVPRLTRYVACAIGAYCYKSGLPYALVASSFDDREIKKQSQYSDILPLTFSDPSSKDYLIPANPILSEMVLRKVATDDPDLIFEVFCQLATAISFYVNRTTIRNITPEARVGRRLFDYDEVVFPWLGDRSEAFYSYVKKAWSWNSRYWEQLALLKLDQAEKAAPDRRSHIISQAITHARHAIRIERHPFPLTTLGRVLLADMHFNPDRISSTFNDAFSVLVEAVNLEKGKRIAVHPYNVLFRATLDLLNNGGKLTGHQKSLLREYARSAGEEFYNDKSIQIMIANLSGKIQ